MRVSLALLLVVIILTGSESASMKTSMNPTYTAKSDSDSVDQRNLRSHSTYHPNTIVDEGDRKNEDRDILGVKKFLRALSKSKVQREQKADEKLMLKLQKLQEQGTSYEDLYKAKVDHFDMWRALKLHMGPEDPRLRKWWNGYSDYWVHMKNKKS
ncbi:unnamed protein product [Phytophthora lilii]|uniref:RxLR effector protein n=1 Tax=Phytophthora lilii TaxID=2077276 RepID=A0A9W6TU43_9STRA|nr:unnamed protein product [Phytophthora lilii]